MIEIQCARPEDVGLRVDFSFLSVTLRTNTMLITARMTRFAVSLAALFLMAGLSAFALEGPKSTPEKEQELLAVLRSDAPPSEKAITCKLLAIHGSSEAVPDLAKLLLDPQLASWARIALEAIPGSASDEALRKAVDSLQGKLLVGTINSIGVRRDSKAVEVLALRLNDPDVQVASAAAVALGHIGTEEARKHLHDALAIAGPKVKSAIAEGSVLAAERLLAEGNAAGAVAIYDEVRKADVSKQRILEATRGAILARQKEGIPLLLEQLQSEDKQLFQIGLSTAREFPGGELDAELAKVVVGAAPERAALIVQAMADRPQTVVLPAILSAAEKGPKPVRLSAVNALARVGDGSCLAALLAIAVDSDNDLAQAAKAALAELPGEKINAAIVELLPKSEGKAYPVLIGLVGQRRIEAAADSLSAAINHADSAVRTAAIAALGEVVAQKGLSILIRQVVAPKHAEDLTVSQQALRAACVRMPDRDACAAELTAALEKSKGAVKGVLLEILGEVGGTKALETIGLAAKSDDPLLQDASSRLLGEWMTLDAAPVLLDLTKSAPGEKYQTRALRGYIRIARQFVLPEDQRAEMCANALKACHNAAEKRLVLEILRRYPGLSTLKLAVNAARDHAEVKAEAIQAILVIAQKLGSQESEVEKLLAQAKISKVKLEIVQAEYGSGAKQKDVTEILRKQVGDLPYLPLPATTYNRSFGGDPAPSSVKKLKIQYKLDGQETTASFAEDAIIVLPKP